MDCQFDHIPTWMQHIPLVCRFQFDDDWYQNHGSYFDWLGVYPVNMVSISKPMHWVYMLTCYSDLNMTRSKTVAEFPSLEPGLYVIGYYSVYSRCLQGLSEPFAVQEHLS
ncbi:inositol polyphosphate 5-phosphatase [Ditylenchus destructor]|nr:inositol polyphosphate 5-phosphatase [Ditylenchus destructor]